MLKACLKTKKPRKATFFLWYKVGMSKNKFTQNKLIWMTGLSGAGKTTVAKEIYAKIKQFHPNTVIIDGDSFREVIGNDLGHGLEDRIKNAYRIVKICKYLYDQDINVVCSTMSLYKEIHEFIYANFKNPLIVYLDVSMEELMKRNQKGLYSEGKNVTGIDLPFDEPINKELVLKINNDNNLQNTINKILERCEIYDHNEIR